MYRTLYRGNRRNDSDIDNRPALRRSAIISPTLLLSKARLILLKFGAIFLFSRDS